MWRRRGHPTRPLLSMYKVGPLRGHRTYVQLLAIPLGSFTCGRYGSPATWDMPFFMASEPLSGPCDFFGGENYIYPTLTLLFRWCHLLTDFKAFNHMSSLGFAMIIDRHSLPLWGENLAPPVWQARMLTIAPKRQTRQDHQMRYFHFSTQGGTTECVTPPAVRVTLW